MSYKEKLAFFAEWKYWPHVIAGLMILTSLSGAMYDDRSHVPENVCRG
jgi:hypothetical protein